ncbi:MAG: LLM class flavin-dependent oxidoreductase [Chloroflexi bacterium]|nr:LLM class flavin-dependent oxidoreductase [Chloroflexota bacterium]
MKELPIGVHVFAGDTPGLAAGIVAADGAGLDVAWVTLGPNAPDPFVVYTQAAAQAQRIQFGTSIVTTFPRHPLAMAQSAMALDQVAPGRLRLGVGPSHKPLVEGFYGIPFERPLAHLREYLTILNAILKEGTVSFQGELLQAEASFGGPTQVSVLASALRPKAFRLCGELTEGAISWMCPLPYIRDVAGPALEEGARIAGRPKPAMIVHAPVVLSEDAEAVRAAAKRQFGFYQRMPYYSQMLQEAGYPEAAGEEFSDAMSDGLVISGSEAAVGDRIRALPQYGVDELLATIVLVGDTPQATADRTLAFLGELAREA